METHVVIIGAGPAGLTAAYLLSKEKRAVTVLEADEKYVGGIARTVTYKGYCFDIGGHRFFSKAKEIEDFWSEMLPNDMLERPRLSRIWFKGQFFSYPLKAFEALRKLGLIESSRCVFSYMKARLSPIKNPKSFSDWVTNHFGKRLFNLFFKTYTEKVWGMRCEDISSDWAAQRIKGLSLSSAIKHALWPVKKAKGSNKAKIKTLINSFRYPRKGPGMLWEACANKTIANGGVLHLGCTVYHCEYVRSQNHWKILYKDQQNQSHELTATHVISSAPLRELVCHYLSPPPSYDVQQLAQTLQYRDFLIVILILKDKKQFPDNWIYIHDNHVDVARIQNFKSWSPEMVPEEGMCCYGMEYFCFKDDKLWAASDDVLIQKAIREIMHLQLASAVDIEDACVVRQSRAYPVYNHNYQTKVHAIREVLEQSFPSLYLVGRNGMHKYNNQDHAMMTAMLTVKNILADERHFDVWQVNQDAEYLELGSHGDESTYGLRKVPEPLN